MSSLVSKIGKNSISNIFYNMDRGEELINMNRAEEWLKENMPDSKITDKVTKFLFKSSKSRCTKDIQNLVQALRKFTCLVEENRSLLVSMLVYLKYTWNDAESIATIFVNELRSCDVLFLAVPAYFHSSVYLSVIEFSDECRNIARNLYSGNYIVRRCLKSDPLIPVYCLLAEFSHRAGLEERITIDIVENEGGSNLMKYLDEYKNEHCPMIITEDADLDSAVDAFTDSICQHQREVAWSISHVFIQESIYDGAKSLLKERLKNIVCGSRLDKSTELQLTETKAELTDEKCKHLEIFKPFSRSPIKICLGWSPNDIDLCETFKKSSGYIVVIPYRNNPELKTLMKENIGLNCRGCSVWSEKNSVKKLLTQLEFSTCWINCHGLIHPLVPFNNLFSIDQTLKCILNNEIIPSNKFNEITSAADAQLNRRFSSALLSAVKGYKEWQKLKIDMRFNILTKIHKTFLSCCLNSQKDCSCKSVMEPHLVKSCIDDKIGFPSMHCDINLKQSPIGVIIFYLHRCEKKIVHMNRFKRLIACSLYNGNAVIVHSDSVSKDNLNDLRSNISDLFETQLPKQALNIVIDFDENIELSRASLIKELSTGPCPFAKVIIVDDSLEDPVLKWSDHSTVSISLADPSLDDLRAITSLTTSSKSIWTYE